MPDVEHPRAIVSGPGARRARRGHPWIYRDDVLSADGAAGDVVAVHDRAGRRLCWAAYSPSSRIALRRVWRASAESPRDILESALAAALARRGGRAAAGAGCARLVHS